tara:strand:- start:1089 stop:1283 length:195 start_codon:yes stop_codon:yes gene_type:complete
MTNIADFPNLKGDKLIEDAWEELDEWIQEKVELGIDTAIIIGILEIFKTAVVMEEMEEWCEEDV